MIFTFPCGFWMVCEMVWVIGSAGVVAPSSAFFNAPSTSCPQWIFMGGSAPRSAESAAAFSSRASSMDLPISICVAMLATAMAVWHPKDWKLALSMILRPFFSVNLSHMRSMSPHSGEPTVPMASASFISPWFCGACSALRTFASNSSMQGNVAIGSISRNSNLWGSYE